MRDYARLCKALRYCATHFSCDGCVGGCVTGSNEPRTAFVLNDAADAIEDLLNRDVVPMDFHERCLELEVHKRIEIEKQMPQWISVEERLPEPGERVLISNGAFVCESFISQSGKWQRGGTDLFFMTPTHWTPLPEPPKEDAE